MQQLPLEMSIKYFLLAQEGKVAEKGNQGLNGRQKFKVNNPLRWGVLGSKDEALSEPEQLKHVVVQYIHRLKSNKASRADGICPRVLKECRNEVDELLTKGRTCSSAIVLEDWKAASAIVYL